MSVLGSRNGRRIKSIIIIHIPGHHLAGFDVAYLPLQSIEALLVFPNLTDSMVSITRVEPVDKERELFQMLAGLLECR